MKNITARVSILIICALIFVILFSFLTGALGQQGSAAVWNTQFGSSADDTLSQFAVDPSGNVFCVGNTRGLMGGASGSGDMFVSKHGPSGTLLWMRQFGTSSGDSVMGTAVDTSGNVYVAGWTEGHLFGTATASDMDSFVAKYDSNGNLVWGQQYRVSGISQAIAVTVGTDGAVYITGATDGNYGGVNAGLDDPSIAPGSDDIYITKLSPNSTTLWTKQFGAAGNDDPSSITLDAGGNIIVAGTTYHWLRAGHGGKDVFLAKLTPDGSIIWDSEFGGPMDNSPSSLYADKGGAIYLATSEGNGQSSDGQPIAGQCKLYSFDSNGNHLWAQQFATQDVTDETEITGITDVSGNLCIAGSTTGNLFGLNGGDRNIFEAKLAADGSVTASNQFGSDASDNLASLASDAAGNLYIGGDTDGSLFSTSLGEHDIFLEKLSGIVQSVALSGGALKSGVICTEWNGKPVQLRYPSFRHGATAYIFGNYLRRAIPGTQSMSRTADTLIISGQSVYARFHLGSPYYYIGSRRYKMSAAPIVKGGGLYLPVDAFQKLYHFPIIYNTIKAVVDFRSPPPRRRSLATKVG